MKIIEFDIENSLSPLHSEVDMVCVEKNASTDKVISSSVLLLKWNQGQNRIRIKFDWKEASEILENDFLFIEETSTLFFRSTNQWVAFDLLKKIIVRHEQAMWLPFIERIDQIILIEDDLQAESTNLRGRELMLVPIDPPTDRKVFADRIEYNSPIFGKQVLKLKK
jgi:hypothetical protein